MAGGGKRPRSLWLYGLHAVTAALANPRRTVIRVIATVEGEARLKEAGATPQPGIVALAERISIDRLVPPGAVHQGIAAEVDPLDPVHIEDVIDAAGERAAVLVLDQVSDPQNVGAIMRTAAAFGALAIVVPERGAPEPTGALAKAAAGAVERVPLVRVVNLKRAIETLKAAGFWCHGFDGDGDTSLADADLGGRVALVMGAEGEGLRPLTRSACDHILRIPIATAMESLNVSNAAAIALYDWARRPVPAPKA